MKTFNMKTGIYRKGNQEILVYQIIDFLNQAYFKIRSRKRWSRANYQMSLDELKEWILEESQ